MDNKAAWQAVADVVEQWAEGSATAEADGVEAVATGTVRDGVLEVEVVTLPAEVTCTSTVV